MAPAQSPYFSPFTNYAAFKAEPGETMNSIFSHSPYFTPTAGALPAPGTHQAPATHQVPGTAAHVSGSQGHCTTSTAAAAAAAAAATAAQFIHPWFNQYAAGSLNSNHQ